MFLSHTDVSLSVSISLSLPSSLSKINEQIPKWGKKQSESQVYDKRLVAPEAKAAPMWRFSNRGHGSAVSAPLGMQKECKFRGPATELRKQKLRAWGMQSRVHKA